MRSFQSLLVLALVAPCLGADDAAAPNPPAEKRFTPALPPAAAPITRADLEEVVDASVRKAMLAMSPSLPTPQAMQAQAPPQTTSAQVLVPPGPIGRGLAKFGTRLQKFGEPRTKPMTWVTGSTPAPAQAAMASPQMSQPVQASKAMPATPRK